MCAVEWHKYLFFTSSLLTLFLGKKEQIIIFWANKILKRLPFIESFFFYLNRLFALAYHISRLN